MERKKVGTVLMFVSCLGVIIAVVGKFVAFGLHLGETAYMASDITVQSFIMLFIIAIAVFGQDYSKDEQNQPEAELDSSLR